MAFYVLWLDGKEKNSHRSSKNSAARQNQKKTKPPVFSVLKVLVVDDDHDHRHALGHILGRRKIKVFAAESGEKAVSLVQSQDFDLIFLDLRMPEMNGAQTLQRISQIKRKYFVVIMTAYPEDEQMKSVMPLNPYGILHKPFEIRDVIPFIEKRLKER